MEGQPASKSTDVLVLIALVMGVLGLCAWLLPICGFPLSLAGLVLGIVGRKSDYRYVVLAALGLCAFGLIASVINAAGGAYMGVTQYLQSVQGLQAR